MLIVCPNCATSYQIEPASLGPAGRSVRCVRCRSTWFATNTAAMAAIALAHRSDVAAFSATTSVADLAEPAGVSIPETATEAIPEVAADPALDAATAMPPQAEPDTTGPAEPARRDPDDLPAPAAVVEAPPLVPGGPEAPPHGAIQPSPPEDVESVAARRIRRPPTRRRSASPLLGVPALVVALLAINLALIGWRADVVRWLPQTASLYAAVGLPVNLRGLSFSDIDTRRETKDGVQVLVVEGFIRNETRRTAQVPRLRLSVRNGRGQEIYSWTALPARNAIPAGAVLPFRSRLASPPPETHQVLVRFFNKRDLVAGIQ
jgi:predicted Zn finger-like uncharacterized protein